jgi:hypothetical protein
MAGSLATTPSRSSEDQAHHRTDPMDRQLGRPRPQYWVTFQAVAGSLSFFAGLVRGIGDAVLALLGAFAFTGFIWRLRLLAWRGSRIRANLTDRALWGLLGTLLASILLLALPSPQSTGEHSVPTTTTPECEELPRKVRVHPVADLQRFGVAFQMVSVEVSGDSGQMYRRFAGTLAGKVPSGSRLYLLGWADPNSHDSTRDRRPGSGLYHLADKLDPNPQGCWATPKKALAYQGARGLDFEYYFTLVPDAIRPQLDAYRATQQYEKNGLTQADISRFGLQQLAFFRVET